MNHYWEVVSQTLFTYRRNSNKWKNFRIYKISHREETSTLHAVQWLEREHPDLWVRVQEKARGGKIYIKSQDEEAAFSLFHLSRETTVGITLGDVKGRPKGIVLWYPLGQSLWPILEDPHVTFARFTYNAGHCRQGPMW